MMLQDYLVYLILILTAAFTVYRMTKKVKATTNGACGGCAGCSGCSLRPANDVNAARCSAAAERKSLPPSHPMRVHVSQLSDRHGY